MLNFAFKGTYQDQSGYDWDFYADDQLDPDPDPNTIYIIPRPQFVTDNNGNPSFQITDYALDGSKNGTGYLRFDVELSIPAYVQAGVAGAIKADQVKFPNVTAPVFVSLDINKGSIASFELNTDGVITTHTADVSDFGGNVASFMVSLTKAQLDTVSASFGASGGAVTVTYYLSVQARLQGVSAALSFDSSIAYQYQVTQATYNSWGDEESPESVTKLLTESASSKVTLTWGMANPPSDLVSTVTSWANNTLADLVSAEVQKVIELQGLQSDNSFSINEVSSFTSNFTENMVVAWLIQPSATLPTFPDMHLQLNNFTSSVNELKQQMTVSTNLPFYSDSKVNPSQVPSVTVGGISKQAFVKSLVVTVKYPTLTEADGTCTFTANGSKTFSANYDLTQKSVWSLEYEVNYEDPDMAAVSGKITGITTGSYVLKVEEAGILTVLFDASQAFNGSESILPTELVIDFSYVNGLEPAANSIAQSITIKSTDTALTQTISSLQPMPISTTYNYQVTYKFPSVVYQAPVVQNQNGFSQTIFAANVVHPVNIISYITPAEVANNPVFGTVINMWYAEPPTVPPGVSTQQPNKQGPAVFNISYNDLSNGGSLGKATFTGLLSGDQPLMYSASISTANGPIDIDAQQIANSAASIMVTPTQQYYTLEIDPASLNWSNGYSSVIVLITMVIAQGTATTTTDTGKQQQQSVTWNKGESGSKYLTVPIQTGNTVAYNTEVRYITPGSADKVDKTSDQTDVVFEVPAIPNS